MAVAVIEVDDLHRTYRTTTGAFRRRSKDVEAVRGVSFEVGEGELFGLLGPNGAGKTTTIKMLITLLIPTAGTARVLGYDVVESPREVRRRNVPVVVRYVRWRFSASITATAKP